MACNCSDSQIKDENVHYTGPNLYNLGIVTNTPLNEILQRIDLILGECCGAYSPTTSTSTSTSTSTTSTTTTTAAPVTTTTTSSTTTTEAPVTTTTSTSTSSTTSTTTTTIAPVVAFYGVDGSFGPPTLLEITSSSNSVSFVSGADYIADFTSFSEDLFWWIAEPSTEPSKTYRYASVLDNDTIGDPGGLLSEVSIVGSYRVYHSGYATQNVTNPQQIKKVP